ncbi:hypothetical protein FKW77_005036 [Venturia effusa]|uniref:Uncharacterized protein n=1 Tax=Venturia effusa TaxID=50376 RepID=A0A517L382_9PEZI|nr:hypothetical protein FKW77_005036 [Venturia effusa]
MEMIKCREKSNHVGQPSEYDCKVQYLMTSPIYIMPSWKPFLWNLPTISSTLVFSDSNEDRLTLAACTWTPYMDMLWTMGMMKESPSPAYMAERNARKLGLRNPVWSVMKAATEWLWLLKMWKVADRRKQIATPKKNVEKTITSAVLAEPYRGRISRKTKIGSVKKRMEPDMWDHMLTVSLCICRVVLSDFRKEWETGL